MAGKPAILLAGRAIGRWPIRTANLCHTCSARGWSHSACVCCLKELKMHSNKLITIALLMSALCLSCNDDEKETREECVPGCSGYKFTTCTDKYTANWKNCPNGCNANGCIENEPAPAPTCKQECINNSMFVSCDGNNRNVETCARGCNENGCIKSDCSSGCSSDGKSFTSCDADGNATVTACDMGCDSIKGCLSAEDFEPCPGEVEYFSVCSTRNENAVSVFYKCFKKGDQWLLRAKRELKCADGCAENGSRCNADIEEAYSRCDPAKWTDRCEDEHILTCNADFHYVDVLNCRDKDSSSMHYICTSVNALFSCQPECAEDEKDGIRECSQDDNGHDSLWQSGCFRDDNDRRYFVYEENITCEHTCDSEKLSCTCPEPYIWSLNDRQCIDPNPPEPEDPAPASCATDNDCSEGLVCKEKACVEPEQKSCENDGDCGEGLVCKEKVCVEETAATCESSNDCDDDLVCSEGHCIKPESKSCVTDDDCDEDMICKDKVCVADDQPKDKPYLFVKIEDLSPAEYDADTEEPGIDIDAIVLSRNDTQSYADSVVSYIRGDGKSNKVDRKAYAPEAVLGAPDAFAGYPEDTTTCNYYKDPVPQTNEDEHKYNFLSLGGQGGTLIVQMAVPLQEGDKLDILELGDCTLKQSKQDDQKAAVEKDGLRVSISNSSAPSGKWIEISHGEIANGVLSVAIPKLEGEQE